MTSMNPIGTAKKRRSQAAPGSSSRYGVSRRRTPDTRSRPTAWLVRRPSSRRCGCDLREHVVPLLLVAGMLELRVVEGALQLVRGGGNHGCQHLVVVGSRGVACGASGVGVCLHSRRDPLAPAEIRDVRVARSDRLVDVAGDNIIY